MGFLNRKYPDKHKPNTVDGNRGEGFLLAYNDFKTCNGIIHISSEVGIGTTMNLQIPPVCDVDEFVLTLEQVRSIYSLKSNKIILFVDDVLLNIKILFYKLLKYLNPSYKYNNFPLITSEQWQSYGMFILEIDTYAFIFAANGLYGNDISLIGKCNLIITDIQMPLMNGIDMIKSLHSNGCKTKIIINTALTNEEIEQNSDLFEMLAKKQIYILEKGNNIDFTKFQI
jgi:CheY-like chemotaxis protein